MTKGKVASGVISVLIALALVVTFSLGNVSVAKAETAVEDPVFSVAGGYYDSAFVLTLTCATPDTDIYYIDDDETEFNRAYWTLYTQPLAIDENCVIRAIAVAKYDVGGSGIVRNYYSIGSMAAGYVSYGMVIGEDTPIAVPTNSPTNLKYAVTTTAEWSEIDAGNSLTVTMEMNNASKTVTDSQKALFAAALNGNTLVQYYDINIYKRLGLGGTYKVLSPNAPMSLVMVVPPEAFNTNVFVQRIYTMLYEFDGVVYSSPVFRTVEGFLYFNAPKSTTYALVYQDYPLS